MWYDRGVVGRQVLTTPLVAETDNLSNCSMPDWAPTDFYRAGGEGRKRKTWSLSSFFRTTLRGTTIPRLSTKSRSTPSPTKSPCPPRPSARCSSGELRPEALSSLGGRPVPASRVIGVMERTWPWGKVLLPNSHPKKGIIRHPSALLRT